MSNEELKIRSELEMDIERDLEQEITDGIYHLALRLHRLYQNQKERNKREISESGAAKKIHQETKKKLLSEVSISIKLDAGTKIEIKEIKKEAPTRPRSSRSDQNFQGMLHTKKFDWARSLRSSGSASAVAISRRNERSLQGKTLSNYPAGQCMNLNPDNNARRNLTSAAGHRKISASVDNN
ncbi:hypothetical protein P3X46_018523 [Hevea brasiliensis]|uniref:Uncharacterized protein n=1 Tax=Hevea brasiliensis TaxID=3981 RepID=A0ABQ9LQZ8_HEVBR|nr:uncharacterized protein LOC110634476 [Hevea brasiliensis]KAJ9170414.1 hypothetical protein P3X46_018523 [Hevea brasiliensis]